eukprot:186648_1
MYDDTNDRFAIFALCVFCFLLFIMWFFISWSIIGALLYSEMNTNTVQNQQCADIVISWIVLKLVLYVSVLIFVYCEMYANFYEACGITVKLTIVFGVDIAGLIFVNQNSNECDNIAKQNVFGLGIKNYIMIGGIIHISCALIIMCCMGVFRIKRNARQSYSRFRKCGMVLTIVFFVFWCIIGCILYANIDASRECKSMMISWIVIRFAEPLLVFCWCRNFGLYYYNRLNE